MKIDVFIFKNIFDDQVNRLDKFGHMELDIYMPPTAGGLMFIDAVKRRATAPITNFKALQHP